MKNTLETVTGGEASFKHPVSRRAPLINPYTHLALTVRVGRTNDRMWRDGWTAVTADGKWTAQAEHTLLITDTGVDILTASPMKAAAKPKEATKT